MNITDEDIEIYRRDGVVKLSGVFDPKWIEFMREATEECMSNPGEMAEEYADSEKSTRFFGDQFLWTYNDKFKKFIMESEAAAIAARLMDASKINMFFDHLLVKEPGSVEPTPWHQDGPYWKVKGTQVCSIWFAMDNVREETGGVRYVKGSHSTGIRYRPQSFSGNGNDTYQDGGLATLPDIDATVPADQIICYELKPGDCLVHNFNTIHGAKGNAASKVRRRGYATRWTGEDVVWDPRPGTADIISDPGLAPGDPMDSELFPVVWKK
ncbi:MAG: phytanoyl-CoA dioxygenase family protein [Emcibacteraceae bacterium]|nr:phytanoyl-CoA dioxygenase family protein [Emcibacteraceae bacterium]MDG1995507.1 phytanoyl-CoA dioxygenase family protein [Emcibacteraceae bacterium]